MTLDFISMVLDVSFANATPIRVVMLGPNGPIFEALARMPEAKPRQKCFKPSIKFRGSFSQHQRHDTKPPNSGKSTETQDILAEIVGISKD